MSRWRFALACLCFFSATGSVAAQDLTLSVELDGVLGIVEKKDSDGRLASLVVLVPYSKSLNVVGIPTDNLPSFELNGLPWHVPAIEVDNKNLFGRNAFGTTVVPLLNTFHEISTSCAQAAAPKWDTSTGSVADLPAVRVGGKLDYRAVADPAVLTTPPTSQALAARWVFQCGETISLSDAVDDAGRVVPIESGRLVKQGAWDIESLTNDKLKLKKVTIKRTVTADAKIQLDVGDGRTYILKDFGASKPTLKLRNVPPDELIAGFHPNHDTEDSTFAHFRLLYGLAREEDKKESPYWVLAPKLPSGDPFCSGQGTLLESK